MPTPEVRLGDGRYTLGQLLFTAPVAGALWNAFPIEFVADPLAAFDSSEEISSDILRNITIAFLDPAEYVTVDADWAPIVPAAGNSGLIRGWLPQVRFVAMDCIQGSVEVRIQSSDNNAGMTHFLNVDTNVDYPYAYVDATVGSPGTSSWFTMFAAPGTCGAAPDPFSILHLSIEKTNPLSPTQLASGSVEFRWIFDTDFVPYDVGDPAQTPLSIDYTPPPGGGLTIHATTNQCGQVDTDCTWDDIQAIVEGGTPIIVTVSHGTEKSRTLWAGEMAGGVDESATISFHGGAAQ